MRNDKKILILLLFLLIIFSGCGTKPINNIIKNGDNQKIENPGSQENNANTGIIATSTAVDVSSWLVYENIDFGYKIKYPSSYKAVGDGGESMRSGVSFFNSKIESTPLKTDIHVYDQNYIIFLSEGDRGNPEIFDFSKENINDVNSLKTKKEFPGLTGTIEKMNDLTFLRLLGAGRVIYIVKNPKNSKFLAFEAFVPLQYGKEDNDEKIKNLKAMLDTLVFIEPMDAWQSFEDKTDGFVVNYPGPLQFSKDLIESQNIFVAQFFYSEDSELPMNHVKVILSKEIVDKNESFDSVVSAAAQAKKATVVSSCSIGGKIAKCFNGKEYNEYGEIDTVYSENIFFENNGNIYNMYFYSPGSIKNKFENIFKEIQNKFKFIK